MNPRRSFVRKIVYLAAIAILLVPLFWLSQPTTRGSKAGQGSPGGQLAQLRAKYGLTETQLGDIDPTSETIELATFGMRGIAANLLWEKSNRYKMKKDWTNLSATLEQLSKLEPHFVAVWQFQAWNLSYNVSAEFDDYRERFRWVIKGLKFLDEGISFNKREPRLLSYSGWITSHKIGRADEAKQFRQLYKDPDNVYDIHGTRPVEQRDNWLVGKEQFEKAEKLVDSGAPLRGTSPVVFHSYVAMCQMNYADAIEQDGIFAEKARRAWNRAEHDWNTFGAREIPTSVGESIRLNEGEMLQEQVAKLSNEIDAFEPGLREKIAQEKRDALTDDMRKALETPADKRTDEQHRLAYDAGEKLRVTPEEVAKRVQGTKRREALKLAKQAADDAKTAEMIDRYRQIVNFTYWRRRAQIEQTDEATKAREFIYLGNQAYKSADLGKAKDQYDEGFKKWRSLLDKPEFASLKTDRSMVEDLGEVIKKYREILEKRDEGLPKDFILQDIANEAAKLQQN
jgi:hypothetical protein